MNQREIGRMFSKLAPRYDRFNQLSSFGLDKWWRQRLAKEFHPGERILDLGTGTGELSFLFAQKNQPLENNSLIVGTDLSFEMLTQAQRVRLLNGKKKPFLPHWVQSSAESLPFDSGRFDGVVSAYVMRNLQRAGILKESLKEAYRVLKPGGRLVFLDLTRPKNWFLRWGHSLYMKSVVPFIGFTLFGSSWPGSYLKRSIEDLLPPKELSILFKDCGFSDFYLKPLSGGIVSLFFGRKS